jgi:hypothetical protein
MDDPLQEQKAEKRAENAKTEEEIIVSGKVILDQ